MKPIVAMAGLFVATVFTAGCQGPTDPSDVDQVSVDDFVLSTVVPDPITASASQGRTYRVVVGNNQPDEVREYDWFASFRADVTITDEIMEVYDDDDDDFQFPITVTSATVTMAQASGGIRNPPTGGQTEYFESVLVGSTSNRFASVNTSVGLSFDVWYDMPSLRKDAIVTITVSFRDDDGRTFQKVIESTVAP
jgi:hypothetical protein